LKVTPIVRLFQRDNTDDFTAVRENGLLRLVGK
jgi:hypothetical protein